jgi:hypothetical protein
MQWRKESGPSGIYRKGPGKADAAFLTVDFEYWNPRPNEAEKISFYTEAADYF